MDFLKRNASIIIALIALIATFSQMYLQAQKDKISVRPVISAYFSLDGRDESLKDGIYFYNGGLGNAIVHKIIILIDGKPILDPNQAGFYNAMSMLGRNPNCYVYSTPRENDFLIKDVETSFIEAKKPTPLTCQLEQTSFILEEIFQREKRLDFKIQFSSLYDEKFTYFFRENKQVSGWR